MQTGHELFLHELSDMLDAEHRILESLSQQAEESSTAALQSAFQAHHKQTQSQIERLEQCFELLGEEAEQTACAGIKGLREEHETMIAEDPSPDILDVFNIGAGIKVERYEISSYESLIRLAELMNQPKVVRLLKQSLKEEEQTLTKLAGLAAKVKPENLETGEAEVEEVETVEEAVQEETAHLRPHIVKRSGPRKNKAA